MEILLWSQVKFLFEGAEKVGVVRESTAHVNVSYGQTLLNQFLGHKQAFFQDIISDCSACFACLFLR